MTLNGCKIVKGEYRNGTLFIHNTTIGLSIINCLTNMYKGYFLIQKQGNKWIILDFISI